MRAKAAPKSAAHEFRVGDPVWVLRPRAMGTHRTKSWFTPGDVVRRIGGDTYRIKVGPGQFRERHESQLRPHEPDVGVNMCPGSTAPMGPTGTMTMLSRTTTPS